MQRRIPVIILIIILILSIIMLYTHKERSSNNNNKRLVVGFYLVANDKLKNDILEDYQEIINGSRNFSGVIYVIIDMEDKVVFSKVENGKRINLSESRKFPSLINRYALGEFISTLYQLENIDDFILILGGENGEKNRLFNRGEEYLIPEDIKYSLQFAKTKTPDFHISLLQIDMCNIINYDVVDSVYPYCDFILGSEIEIHSKGHKYDKELLLLNDFSDKKLFIMDRVLDIFTSEHRYYRINSQFSLISSEGFEENKKDLDTVLSALKEETGIDQIINASAIKSKNNYLDLRLALTELAKLSNKTIKNRIENILRNWENIVIRNCIMSQENSQLGGIGYYLQED